MNWYMQAIIIISASTTVLNQSPTKEYGPFKLEFTKYETCKGPKRGECGTVRIESIHNMSDIPFILDFPKDCPVKNAKITIGSIQNDRSKKLWNYQVNQPCQHFVLGPLLTKSFNLTNGCIIEKGHYEVHINMIDLTTKFLGSSFFYDTYYFKTVAYNNVNNFFCVYNSLKISKIEPLTKPTRARRWVHFQR